MKKLLYFVLAAAMIFTSLVSCNSNPTTGVSSTASSTASSKASEPPMELTWLVYNQIGVTAVSDSPVKKLIEEKFNVKITIPKVDIHTLEQWDLYWASGNSPDASFTNIGSTSTFKLVDQGLVRSIPEGYLEKYMPDYMKSIYSFVDKTIVNGQISYNGNQYVIPYAGFDVPFIMGVRKDWMDAVGVTALPTTPDELFDLAKKFTFNDPDKDGKNDTYGINGGSSVKLAASRFGYLNTFYGVWPDAYYNIDGKITYTSLTDAYKNSLKYLNTWYKAGVVDPEFATDTREIQRKKWAEGQFGIISDHPWWFSKSTPANLTESVLAANPKAEVVYLAPFKDANGKQLGAKYHPNVGGDATMFFGKNCTDEKMQKMMEIRNNFVVDWDFYVRCDYGVKDTDYTISADGLIVPNASSRTPEYMTAQGLYAFTLTPVSYENQKKYILSKEDVVVYDFASKSKPLYVGIDFDSLGLNKSFATYSAGIQTISDEFYYNAIMGKVDIDTGFEKFKTSLINAGLQKVIDEYQASLVK